MSKKIDPTSVRKQISNELLALYQVLRADASGVVIDPDGILAAVNEAKRDCKGAVWEYTIANLHLRVDMPQNVLPTNCGESLDIVIDLDIKGVCNDFEVDCITDLIMNLKIVTESGENVCCWHFDRHLDGDKEEGTSGSEAHPLYHFQHGGHAMKPHAQLLGSGLLLPSPRLPFPPMDAVLSFDFVLSNFSGPCWSGLRDDPTYSRLLRDAQKRHWKPYMEKLASWWEAGPKDDSCTTLWPHLMA